MVYIILRNGFEEIEAVSACDILRRGGVETCYVGEYSLPVTGAHGIKILADMSVEDMHADKGDMVVIPGGMGGVNAIEGSKLTLDAILDAAHRGASLAAICAGPKVFAKLDLLRGKNITCYPGLEERMYGGICHPDKSTVTDGELVTGRAPGASIDFGLALLAYLEGSETAERVKSDLVYDR